MKNLTMLQEQLDKERRKVDVDHFDITVREIARMVSEQEIHLAPEYQRKFRWDEKRESQLIESLFLGLPVPSIYVATNEDGTWELVDGLQRVSTICHYFFDDEKVLKIIDKKQSLKLAELEKLSELNSFAFNDLPSPTQILFSRRPLRVTVLSDKSDTVARFDLFERLNTGGIALSPQEVRACIYRGEFAEFIRFHGDNKKFIKILKLQKLKQEDGTREEQVLKFFAYLFYREHFDGNVTKFLNSYMENALKSFNFDKNKALFENVIEKIYEVLEGNPFIRKNYGLTPLNQLEAVMVGIGELIVEGKGVKKPPKGWINDEALVSSSQGGTNTTSSLARRIKRARELFSK